MNRHDLNNHGPTRTEAERSHRDIRKTGYPSMDEDEQSRASGDGHDAEQGSRTPRNKHEGSGKQSELGQEPVELGQARRPRRETDADR